MDEHNKDIAAPDVEPEVKAQDSTASEAGTHDNTALDTTSPKASTPHSNRTGWDGKLRLNSEKQAVLANPEALENSDYEDDDAPPVDQIAADEGGLARELKEMKYKLTQAMYRLAGRGRPRDRGTRKAAPGRGGHVLTGSRRLMHNTRASQTYPAFASNGSRTYGSSACAKTPYKRSSSPSPLRRNLSSSNSTTT